MSSERRGGRSGTPAGAAQAAVLAGLHAVDLVIDDTQDSYLGNIERQLAVERLLIRFGEALKDIPDTTLTKIDPNAQWSGPKGFRDLAAHWYEDGLDHELIWRALKSDLPILVSALQTWLAARSADQ